MLEIAAILGKQHLARRLLGSMRVDISQTMQLLAWSPPQSVEEGMGEMLRWYLDA